MMDSSIMKKILCAFESRDSNTIRSLLFHHEFSPNYLIPSKGVSFLHLIIGHESENFAFKIVKLFLQCGGDPNVKSTDGVTPIHVAAAWGRNRVLHLLLINGGNPWMQDDEKRNAFNYAFEEKEWHTIELLHHFQQIYSSAISKSDMESPKIAFTNEKVLQEKRQEIVAYSPTKKFTKSAMTQTYNNLVDTTTTTTVQNKIKQFEPNCIELSDSNNSQKFEKLDVGWSKDLFQTTCEVVVHCDACEKSKVKADEKKTYISSIHISRSSCENSNADKFVEKSMNIRSQLFMELQEAVRRRRSKFKISEQDSRSEISSLNHSNSNSLSHTNANSFVIDSFSDQLRNPNLEKNQMIKSMSEFSTQAENCEVKEKTIDLCISSPELSNSYISCEDDFSVLKSDISNIQTFLIPQNNSKSFNLYETPHNSNIDNNVACENCTENDSKENFFSVCEECKNTDEQESVVLIEDITAPPKVSVTPTAQIEDDENEGSLSTCSKSSSLPSSVSCDSDILRFKLKSLGYNSGPITKTTKKLYLKKLWKLKQKPKEDVIPTNTQKILSVRTSVLRNTLSSVASFDKISTYRGLEEKMCLSFDKLTKRKWREGNNKTSFNYLLLDPRISLDLPKRTHEMSKLDTWNCFLSAIFYVGKGKRSRPYAHLHQAASIWERRTQHHNEKITTIIDIWREGLGVVCLQMFQNIMPVEAFTREAAMIDALGLNNLKNTKTGEYYGSTSTWSKKEKLRLGIFLLHKAMVIFLNEGEKQIKPFDIG